VGGGQMVRQNSEREEASIAYATPVGLTLAVAGGWLRARGGSHSNGIASSAADCDGFERRGLGLGQSIGHATAENDRRKGYQLSGLRTKLSC